MADGLVANPARGDALSMGDFGRQFERPYACRFAECARSLVQEIAQPFAAVSIEDGVRAVMGNTRAGLEGSQAVGIEIVDSIADGLTVATEIVGNKSSMQSAVAGEQNLAAAEGKGIGRTQAGFDSLLLVGSKFSYINRFSHVIYYSTFLTMVLGNALGVGRHLLPETPACIPGAARHRLSTGPTLALHEPSDRTRRGDALTGAAS
jgi:hypothetical protein